MTSKGRLYITKSASWQRVSPKSKVLTTWIHSHLLHDWNSFKQSSCLQQPRTGKCANLMEEEIYMEFPPGMPGKVGQAVRLHKGLYGLKQENQYWNKKLDSTMLWYNYLRISVDHCVYRQVSDMGGVHCCYPHRQHACHCE